MSVFHPKTGAAAKNLSISNKKSDLFLLNADAEGPTIALCMAFTHPNLDIPQRNFMLRIGKPTRAGYVFFSDKECG
jgi:hypothetical protein